MSRVFILLLVLLISSFKNECDTDTLFEKSVQEIQPYSFMKKFDITSEKSEYSYVLSRDVEYKIFNFNSDANVKMIVNFYDRNKKLIASNYVKSSKKVFPSITYKCAATGVYYVEASFEGDKKGCGINIIGFKK